MVKIVVVIPYTTESDDFVYKVIKLHKDRAGIKCDVYAVKDDKRLGGFAIQNEMAKKLRYDYYCYSWIDYFPAVNYLKNAIEAMIEHKKGLCGFNDGKWNGNNATAGVIHKSLLKTNYKDSNLFYTGYRQHFADPDLTAVAKKRNQYVYEPSAILMEIDYDKDIKSSEHLNKDDYKLYVERLKRGFPKE
jgi:hypothetical protein